MVTSDVLYLFIFHCSVSFSVCIALEACPMFFMCFCSEVYGDGECCMNTVDTPIFGVQVAEGHNTFGFFIELVDGKSSTNCTVITDDFT